MTDPDLSRLLADARESPDDPATLNALLDRLGEARPEDGTDLLHALLRDAASLELMRHAQDYGFQSQARRFVTRRRVIPRDDACDLHREDMRQKAARSLLGRMERSRWYAVRVEEEEQADGHVELVLRLEVAPLDGGRLDMEDRA